MSGFKYGCIELKFRSAVIEKGIFKINLGFDKENGGIIFELCCVISGYVRKLPGDRFAMIFKCLLYLNAQ